MEMNFSISTEILLLRLTYSAFIIYIFVLVHFEIDEMVATLHQRLHLRHIKRARTVICGNFHGRLSFNSIEVIHGIPSQRLFIRHRNSFPNVSLAGVLFTYRCQYDVTQFFGMRKIMKQINNILWLAWPIWMYQLCYAAHTHTCFPCRTIS